MTLKRRIQIDVSLTSDCSEADLYSHIADITKQIEVQAKRIPGESWNNRIHTNWDTSYGVSSFVQVTVQDIEE